MTYRNPIPVILWYSNNNCRKIAAISFACVFQMINFRYFLPRIDFSISIFVQRVKKQIYKLANKIPALRTNIYLKKRSSI